MSQETPTEPGISFKDLGIDPKEADKLLRSAQEADKIRSATLKSTKNRSYNNPPTTFNKHSTLLAEQTPTEEPEK
jgi:hypothetical protein